MNLAKIINDFKSSCDYKNMITGDKYFRGKNDILNRQFYYNTVNGKTMDKYRANNTVPNNFFKIIVEQKVNYCVGNDVMFENATPYLDLNENLDYVCEQATIKAVGWLHVYVNEMSELKQVVIPSEQIIPIYSNTVNKDLLSVIRFYELDGVEIAEVWDTTTVTYYANSEGGYESYASTMHFSTGSFGKIPFIPLLNNRSNNNDLESIKTLIDCYDVVISDFCNNFEDFQEVIYKLVNYAKSIDDEQMAAELFEFIKKYKFVNVDSEGDFDILQQEVPYQARKEILIIIKQNIYLIAMAVDPDVLKGGSLTNVVIEASYTLLELKANKFIKMIKKFLKEVLYFDNFYRSLKKMQTDDILKLQFEFNKAIIMNKSEIIESLVLCVQNGIMSTETAVNKNPYIDNPAEEMLKLKKESDEKQSQFEQNINTGVDQNNDTNLSV